MKNLADQEEQERLEEQRNRPRSQSTAASSVSGRSRSTSCGHRPLARTSSLPAAGGSVLGSPSMAGSDRGSACRTPGSSSRGGRPRKCCPCCGKGRQVPPPQPLVAPSHSASKIGLYQWHSLAEL